MIGDCLLEHDVKDETFESDDGVWGGGWSGFLVKTIAADGCVEAIFGVGVCGVKAETDLVGAGHVQVVRPRWWCSCGHGDDMGQYRGGRRRT
jgi:hypothetical protein